MPDTRNRASGRHGLGHDSIGTDHSPVAYLNVPKQHAGAAKKDVVSNPRHILARSDPPPPRGTDRDVLEETAVFTHNGIGMNNAAQARMMEDARRVNLRPDTDIAAKEDAVHLPQQEGETVSELAVLIGLIGQEGNLEVLLIRHEHHLPQPIRI